MHSSLKAPFLPGFSTSVDSPKPRISSVVSELITFENRLGKRIVGFHDFPKGNDQDKRWIIVLPGYGESKTDVLTLSYFLAKNGFHALRFDYSDHVGESDGEILSTTLSKMKDDILSSLDYLYRQFQPTAVGAVASSLASRALLRAAREDDRIRALVNLVSVVDLRKTLTSIYNEDHFEHAHREIANGVMDVLGFQVDADHFLQSAIKDRYENLVTTMDDASHIAAPTVFFVAEKDVWVELEDARRVFDAAGSEQKDFYVLKGAMHRLYENPQVVKEALKAVVDYSSRYLPENKKYRVVQEPNLKEIGSRIRREKERARLIHAVTKEEERDFWKSYLQKYSFIINVHDYWNLLDFIYRLLGEPASGETILDAGCGIGNYGTFLLLKLMYRLQQSLMATAASPFFSYVGIDFVKEAILQAKEAHDGIEAEFGRKLNLFSGQRPAFFSYFLADVESSLPFENHAFDKICCNWVISYLEDPQKAVADMARVLKPKGRMVVTSLKPFADLSEVYRNFVRVADTRQEIEEARKLLTNAGRVKAKEAEGIYHFFSEEELADLLKKSGLKEVETYRSFGNQANVAVGTRS